MKMEKEKAAFCHTPDSCHVAECLSPLQQTYSSCFRQIGIFLNLHKKLSIHLILCPSTIFAFL